MDQRIVKNSRLRSALFAVAGDSPIALDRVAKERVLTRSDHPMRKRTPSDLGYPNGKKVLSFGK